MLISFFLMIITSTSLTVPGQPSPRFNVEAWLAFKNCEMDYCAILAFAKIHFLLQIILITTLPVILHCK